MKRLILIFAAMWTAAGQGLNLSGPLTVVPTPTEAGCVRLRELFANGVNYMSVCSDQTLPANHVLINGTRWNGDVTGTTDATSYVNTRKLNLFDKDGGTAFWDVRSVSNATSAYLQFRDNAGAPVLELQRTSFGAPSNNAYSDLHWLPYTTLTRDVGSTGLRWRAAYIHDLNLTGTCTGCGGLPVIDTTGVVKGSVDATKIVRLEVDGLTTATTRVLTPQDADYILAGINIAQTFTANQAFAANILASGATREIGEAAAPFAKSYVTDTYADYVRVSLPGSNFGTHWRWELGGGGGVFSLIDNVGGTRFSISTLNNKFFPRDHVVPWTTSLDLGDAFGLAWRTLYLGTSLVHNGTTRINSAGGGIFTTLSAGAGAFAVDSTGVVTAAQQIGTLAVGVGPVYTATKFSLTDGTNELFRATASTVNGRDSGGTQTWSISNSSGVGNFANMRFTGLTGGGPVSLCIDAVGDLYRGAPGC